MFWNHVAIVYDLFADVYNAKVHRELKRIVAYEIDQNSVVLECACGTGMLTKTIAPICKHITATDYSEKMLRQTQRKCRRFQNVSVKNANILALDEADDAYDIVIAANVIHLLDEPAKALQGLYRVCKPNGKIIIPTYMNRKENGKASGFSTIVGKAGANFKRSFTLKSYEQFFLDNGFDDVTYHMIDGRVPCAIAIIHIRKG